MTEIREGKNVWILCMFPTEISILPSYLTSGIEYQVKFISKALKLNTVISSDDFILAIITQFHYD